MGITTATAPQDGKLMGCRDGAAPENNDEYALSRFADALYMAALAGLDRKKVWDTAPDSMKMEFNFSRWTYWSI